jgi:glycosyltransferase involved in cell wall biosynthesis
MRCFQWSSSQQILRTKLLNESKVPSISIALATYNGEAYLGDLLTSLVRQTYLPVELVVVDDASVDGTVATVEAFARDAPFAVRLVKKLENHGYVTTFLHAAQLCNSQLVAFCDQDDVWCVDKLARCASIFSSSRAPSVLAHAARAVDSDLNDLGFTTPRRPLFRRYPPGSSLIMGTFLGFTLVFKREVLSYLPSTYFPARELARFGHDDWVIFLAGLGEGLLQIPDVLALYRQHGHNLFGVGPKDTPRPAFASSNDYFRTGDQLAAFADMISNARLNGDLAPEATSSRQWETSLRHRSDAFVARGRLYERTEFANRLRFLLSRESPLRYVGRSPGSLSLVNAAKDVVAALSGGSRLGAGRN